MTVTTWPDGATFKACAQYPARYFTDPQLQSATFEPDRRRGGIQAWSGGRATLIRANRSAGVSVAVRLSKHVDIAAGARYQGLDHYLAGHPVGVMVGTSWQAAGLRVGSEHYPILTMEWVPGMSLDNYLTHRLHNAPAGAIGALATQWRDACRSMGAAKIGHGDIHAGNTLVGDGAAGRINLRLVDYDSVWFPGVTSPAREIGHPAFQHPRRAELASGPNIDAVPNTLTYLSLIALADNPRLWQFHRDDDALLFDRGDLADPSRPVWAALLASRDTSVAALARTSIDWLLGKPARFESLEQALAASGSDPRPADQIHINVWPPRPGIGRGPTPARPTEIRMVPIGPGRNTWPTRPGMPPQRRSVGLRIPRSTAGPAPSQNSWPPAAPRTPALPPAEAGKNAGLLAVLIVLAVVVVIVAIAAAAG